MRASAAVFANSALMESVAAFQSGYPQAVAAIVRAATPEQLKYARGRGKKQHLVGALPRLAAVGGDTQSLELFFELKMKPQYRNDPLFCFADMMRLAVVLQRVDVLDCLAALKTRDPTWTWDTGLMSYAVSLSKRDLRVLEWLHQHLPSNVREIYPRYVHDFASQGNVDMIRWMCEHGYESVAGAADSAAVGRQIEVLEYLYEHTDVRCSPQVVVDAALDGVLGIVKLVTSDQPEETCERALNVAAGRGRLAAVKYLVENGIATAEAVAIDEAARAGHEHVAQYLQKHLPGGGAPRADDTSPESKTSLKRKR